MQLNDNEGGGTTVRLFAGDTLSSIPTSHKHLLTPSLRDAFTDPHKYFSKLALRAPARAMSNWLNTVASQGDWSLELNIGHVREWTMAGYKWNALGVRGATIGLANEPDLDNYSPKLKSFFCLFDTVHWNGFGCAGGLSGLKHKLLSVLPYQLQGDPVDPTRTYIWGSSGCGDMIIYTLDGRAGWFNHENGDVALLGTIEEFLDWVFRKLLSDQSPEFTSKLH